MFNIDTWKELVKCASDSLLLFSYSIYDDLIDRDPHISNVVLEKREELNAEIKRRGLIGKASQL